MLRRSKAVEVVLVGSVAALTSRAEIEGNVREQQEGVQADLMGQAMLKLHCEAEFEIMYGQGISREGEIIELGSSLGIIEKSGAWYAYKGSRIGQGKDNARAYLQSNREVAREIEEQVRARLLPPRQQRNGNGEQAANSA